ncbi:MAG TPA: tetratricopeptide repeat protein [Pirellulales bacterium]|jgi:tetratricopeptide (TPR) repeat protein|nr:tetratricopeptide repeat protein [Pirellulales bacterium]
MLVRSGGLFAVTLSVGLLAASAARGGEPPVGGDALKVLPKRPGVELHVSGRVVGVATPSQMLTVSRESGDWLWVGRGWLLRDEVVTADEAQAFFTAMIEHEPTAFAYASRSRAWFQTEKFDQALADAEAALRLEPRSAVAYKCRGRIRLAQGDSAAAIDDLNTALAIDPKLATALNYRAQSYSKAGGFEQAIADATAAITLDPSITVAYSVRGRALAAVSSYERAVQDFDTLLAMDPRYLPALNNRANALLKLGRYAQCIADYTAALAIERRADVFYNRAIARIHLGEVRLAIEDLTTAIELDPDAAAAYYHRSTLYRQLGQIDRAASDLAASQRLRELRPDGLPGKGQRSASDRRPTSDPPTS